MWFGTLACPSGWFQDVTVQFFGITNDVRMVVRDTKHPKGSEDTMTTSTGKRLALFVCAAFAALALGACSAQSASSSASTSSGAATTSSGASSAGTSASATSSAGTSASAAESNQATASGANASTNAVLGTVSNALAQNEEALVSEYASKFTQETYADATSGLSVTYNLFLPQGYDASKSYPMVVFIADSSCAKGNAEQSLTQGLGALVWATDEWQSAYPCIVCVPTYPETILDDHSGYTTTEYVELTKRLIDSVAGTYAVDSNRIYGTGQSMGCMTTLILASEYPNLYAACMFVDGQWDVSTLKGLEGQKFVYFAAEDDQSAFAGMTEVMNMFTADGVSFASAQWDGTWTPDELTAAANELFASGNAANFISWKTGTIEAGSMGGSNSGGAPASGSAASSRSAASGSSQGSSSRGPGGGGAGGAMGGASYHMASFDYDYNCIAVMEWLFQQAN